MVRTLLNACEENDATAVYVLSCLNRMGQAAGPAAARIQAELTLRRRGHWRSVDVDEELQRTCRTILDRLPSHERR